MGILIFLLSSAFAQNLDMERMGRIFLPKAQEKEKVPERKASIERKRKFYIEKGKTLINIRTGAGKRLARSCVIWGGDNPRDEYFIYLMDKNGKIEYKISPQHVTPVDEILSSNVEFRDDFNPQSHAFHDQKMSWSQSLNATTGLMSHSYINNGIAPTFGVSSHALLRWEAPIYMGPILDYWYSKSGDYGLSSLWLGLNFRLPVGQAHSIHLATQKSLSFTATSDEETLSFSGYLLKLGGEKRVENINYLLSFEQFWVESVSEENGSKGKTGSTWSLLFSVGRNFNIF